MEMTNHGFCPACGEALLLRELKNEGMIPWCPKCEAYRFPMYNVAVSMVVISQSSGRILLIRQYGRPFYILVAGYVNRGETLEHAAVRELREETGLTALRVSFNRTSFFEPSNTLMCNFTVHVGDESELSTNEEIDDCAWFTPQEARASIKPDSLASRFLNAYLEDASREERGEART